MKAKKTNAKASSAKTPDRGRVFRAVFEGGRIFSNSKEAFSLYESSRFGEPKEGKIYYSIVEAQYLLEKGRIQAYKANKKLSMNAFTHEAQLIENNFHTRFVVFKDMRNRGYILKTALKFGADFRVYERGVKPGEDHAKWILYPVFESAGLTWHEFAAKNRVAHSTKKNLLIAIVDDENDVTYYEIAWKRP